MKRLITLAMVLFALSLVVAPAAASQDDNGDGPMNKKKCEEAGGVWHNERGEKYCATISEVPFERPVGTVPQEFEDFWSEVDEGIDELLVTIEESHSQRGNVGARGTADSYIFHLTCETSPLAPIIPESICRILAAGPVR